MQTKVRKKTRKKEIISFAVGVVFGILFTSCMIVILVAKDLHGGDSLAENYFAGDRLPGKRGLKGPVNPQKSLESGEPDGKVEGENDKKHYTPGSGKHSVDAYDLRDERIQKFISDELHSKEMLHVSVLTKPENLLDYASVINRTWVPLLSQYGMTQFFSFPISHSLTLPSQVIQLYDLPKTEAYHGKHGLLTIKHLCEQHLDHFHWFLVAMDTTFINTNNLITLLQKLKSTDALLLGCTQKSNDHHGNSYISAPGMVLSRLLVQLMCPQVDQCIHDTSTGDMAAQVAKCAEKHANIDTHAPQQMCNLFRHTDSTRHQSVTLTPAVLHKIVGFGPVYSIYDFHKLHVMSLKHRVQQAQHRAKGLRDRILGEARYLGKPPAIQKKLKIGSRLNKAETFLWHFMDSKINEAPVCDGDGSYSDVWDRMVKNGLERVKRESLVFQYGYATYHLDLGLESQIHFCSKERCHRHEVFTQFQLHHKHRLKHVEEYSVTQPALHFIVPVNSNSKHFSSFLRSYEKHCLEGKRDALCTLLVLLYKPTDDQGQGLNVQELASKYKSTYVHSGIMVVDLTDRVLSCVHALQFSKSLLEPDSLMIFVQDHMTTSADFIRRCHSNTVRGKQVYFPMPVKLGENKKTELVYNSVQTMCVYQSDIDKVLPVSSMHDLLHHFVKSSNVSVMQAPEPGIVMEPDVRHPCV